MLELIIGLAGVIAIIGAGRKRTVYVTRRKRSRTATSQWRRVRRKVLARDGYRCVRCGSTATPVHHRRRVVDGGTDDPKNLVSLCPQCHHEVHYGVR